VSSTISARRSLLWTAAILAVCTVFAVGGTTAHGRAAGLRHAPTTPLERLTTLAPGTSVATAMFRGDAARSGTYRGGGPALAGLAWRVATDGDVVSSPAIAGGVVYVGSNDGYLYALDLATGARRWRTSLGGGVSSAWCTRPAATAASPPSTPARARGDGV
jgi:hypothetical protein